MAQFGRVRKRVPAAADTDAAAAADGLKLLHMRMCAVVCVLAGKSKHTRASEAANTAAAADVL